MMTPEIAFILLGCTALVLLIWGLVRGSRPMKWLCGFLLLFIVFGDLIDIPSPTARNRAKRVHCMHNLRQIGLAIERYRVEHGGTNPPSLQVLTNDCNHAKLFVCIASGNPTGDLSRIESWTSYTYRPESGTNDVRLFCPPKNHRNEGGNVLFGDCMVAWFDRTRFAEVLKAGTKPAPTTPPTVPSPAACAGEVR